MLDTLVERYRWAEQDGLVALTITVVAGRTEDEVVRAFGGGGQAARRLMTFRQIGDMLALPEAGSLHPMLIVSTGTCVVTIENTGYHGSIPEIARRASAGGGRFFSAYWDMHGDHQVMYAEDGDVRVVFDPVDTRRIPAGAAVPLPRWAEGVRPDTEAPGASCLALMERVMRVRIDRDWMVKPLSAVILPDPATMFDDPEAAWLP
ncbi:DUF6461 domain-containing protein [Yinghuangia seranimata]|uniref:DUF6461 domain-containing protein n=1 Tax=Yinghuangia seranimata TaxID=408067 RepID=UPI00248C19D7|nr:DUF6461 domain-containing protein [Yinghuangia seranimata]MDI2125837.1 DUF6461 domain-containing protein [Yinghuangia seranimata]